MSIQGSIRVIREELASLKDELRQLDRQKNAVRYKLEGLVAEYNQYGEQSSVLRNALLSVDNTDASDVIQEQRERIRLNLETLKADVVRQNASILRLSQRRHELTSRRHKLLSAISVLSEGA